MKYLNHFIKSFKLFFCGLGFVSTTQLGGCYYDKEEVLYPPTTTCDTLTVRYTNDVAKVLSNAGCISCHASSGGSGGVALETYAEVKTQALNGRLYGAMAALPNYTAMPPSGKLDECTILRIKKWVDMGAPEN